MAFIAQFWWLWVILLPLAMFFLMFSTWDMAQAVSKGINNMSLRARTITISGGYKWRLYLSYFLVLGVGLLFLLSVVLNLIVFIKHA